MALPKRSDHLAQPSDAQLASEAARGQVDALGNLYRRFARDLLAVAYRLLQPDADAEDVVHDVFVGLPEALRRYEERGDSPMARRPCAGDASGRHRPSG